VSQFFKKISKHPIIVTLSILGSIASIIALVHIQPSQTQKADIKQSPNANVIQQSGNNNIVANTIINKNVIQSERKIQKTEHKRDTSAQMTGNVYETYQEAGKSDPLVNPLAGAIVSIVGSAGSTSTDAQGFFSLPANAADGEDVRIHASKLGYETKEQYHPAGKVPAFIVLERKKP